MKNTILTFAVSLISIAGFAQTPAGSIAGYVMHQQTKAKVAGASLYLHNDSTVLDSAVTDHNGNYRFGSLAEAVYHVEVKSDSLQHKIINNLAVQDRQIARLIITVTKGHGTSSYHSNDLGNASLSPDGVGGEHPNGAAVPSDGSAAASLIATGVDEYGNMSGQLSEFEVVCYSVPLIDRHGGSSGAVVSRQELQKMPARGASAIAGTVGGVYTDPISGELNVRGARSDANVWFVDGVKMNSAPIVAQSALESVQVITGGVPANYGDATGGIISITTRSQPSMTYNGYDQPATTSRTSTGNGSFYNTDFDEFFTAPNTEEYEVIYENDFLNPIANALSTFSIDVDAASYSNTRRFLHNGHMPPHSAVRTEELINYFNYDYEKPARNEPFTVNVEAAPCPWNSAHQLVQIGLKGYELTEEERPVNNLVFLIDVSGSMGHYSKLPLLKKSMRMLVDQMRPTDRISIVAYASQCGVMLRPTSGHNKSKILRTLTHLEAGGSTDGGKGIQTAYKLAQENFLEGGNNRIILCTDGDFNVGVSSTGELDDLISEKRDTGIFLTVLGFGMGNYKDNRLETLADQGNGNYAYIDNILEAKKVLVTEMMGTMYTIAKDVKLQIEFNPSQVKAYRLVGYENRLLAAKDFNDDSKDAGELGSGHTVTALYEIIPASSNEDISNTEVDSLKYQTTQLSANANSNEMMTIKLRYKKPTEDVSNLIVRPVHQSSTEISSDNFRFSAAVAAFSMLLRDSDFKGTTDYQQVIAMAKSAMGEDVHGYRSEFIQLVRTAEVLAGSI
jgi:Ca-activated chloride channel family protein